MNSFMSYKEFCRKTKDLSKKIAECNARIDFSYSNMGQVNRSAEKMMQRYLIEKKEIYDQAVAWHKEHKNWIK